MPDADKKTLRARLRDDLWSLDAQQLRDASDLAADRLCDSDEFARAQSLMIFLPLVHEIDPRSVAIRAWQAGKSVTVPLVSYEQRHMIPLEIRSLDEPMDPDRFGVRAPRSGSPVPVDLIDLVIVPGLGFDLTGHRLGRGGGFYDRFLAQPTFTGISCGLALDRQLVHAVPVQIHDVPLNMLVTDRRLVRFDRADHHA
jgi:5-formyltetrahydrofolate cyclo-ligase